MIQVIRSMNSSSSVLTGRGRKLLPSLNHYHQNGSSSRLLFKSTLVTASSSSRSSVSTKARQEEQFVEPKNVSNMKRTLDRTSESVMKVDSGSDNQVNPMRRVSKSDISGVSKSDILKSNYSYFNYKSDGFVSRHIGPREEEREAMVNLIGFKSVDELIQATVPSSIRCATELDLDGPMTESELVERLKEIGSKNRSDWRSFIGMGYYNCHTPSVIMRNVLENPGN